MAVRVTTRERVRELRADGLVYREIAERLGISYEHAKKCGSPGISYESSKRASREAKKRRTGTCESCGGPTQYNGRTTRGPSRFCADCGPAAYRTWTRDNVIAAIQRFATEHGRAPHSTDFRGPHSSGYPSSHTVQSLFGSWASGVEAAGFTRPRAGVYDRRKRVAA